MTETLTTPYDDDNTNYRQRMQMDAIDEEEEEEDAHDNDDEAPVVRRISFCEEVTVFHIDRKSEQEADLLFWHEHDYQRMRAEETITSTRRKRSRMRDLKRRMAENVPPEDDGKQVDYRHSDSLRLTMNRLKSSKIIANAA